MALAKAINGSVRKPTAGTLFRWSSIQTNNNTVSREHHDANNDGFSLIALFGMFVGGFFVAEDCGIKSSKDEVWHVFDGRKAHSSTPFVGVSFSVVVFYHKSTDNLSEPEKNELLQLGF